MEILATQKKEDDYTFTVSSITSSESLNLFDSTSIGLGGNCSAIHALEYLKQKHNLKLKKGSNFYRYAIQLAIRTTTIKQFEIEKGSSGKVVLKELTDPKRQEVIYATFPNAKFISDESEYKTQVYECLVAMRNTMSQDEILLLPIPGAFMPREDPTQNGLYRKYFLEEVNKFCEEKNVPILIHTVNGVKPEARAGGYDLDESKLLTSSYALIAPFGSDMDVNHFTLLQHSYKPVTLITADPIAHSGNVAKDGLTSGAQAADERGVRLGPAQVVVTDPTHNPAIYKKLELIISNNRQLIINVEHGDILGKNKKGEDLLKYDIAFIDPAGLIYIKGEKNLSNAGGASRDIYDFLNLQNFDLDVKNTITQEGEAKFKNYQVDGKECTCIHVVGPNFNYYDENHYVRLSKAYKSVFEEFIKSGKKYYVFYQSVVVFFKERFTKKIFIFNQNSHFDGYISIR